MAAIVALVCCAHAGAQEVYRASWTIQDPTRGLTQRLAEEIIDRANDWLTRDDPNAPTARVDDLLRVTVVGEIGPEGALRTRLGRVVLGSIAIEQGFAEFVDSATIERIVRRDYFWRDEQVEVFDIAAAPFAPVNQMDAGLPERTPFARLALDESRVRVADELDCWAGLGFDDLALPGVASGRGRAGVAYGSLRAWGEFPAAIGPGSSGFSSGFEPAYGAGISFEHLGLGRWFAGIGGMASAAGTNRRADTSQPGPGFILGKAALLYAVFNVPVDILDGNAIRVRGGLGYSEAVPLARQGETGTGTPGGVGALRAMLRVETRALDAEGFVRRSAAIGMFGGSVSCSWYERFTEAFGMQVSIARHGLLAERDAFMPEFSLFLTPVIIIR